MLKISKTITVFSFSLLIAFASFAVVSGHEGGHDGTEEHESHSIMNAETDATTAQESEQLRNERIEARKEQRQDFLSQDKEQRLAERCVKAQDKLKAISTKIATSEVTRVRAYDKLIDKLGVLTERLQTAQHPTDELTVAISELTARVATFEAESSNYKLIIADVIAMDCVADPQGFLVTLQSAREQVGVVKESSRSVKLYVVQELRPILESYKTKANATTES